MSVNWTSSWLQAFFGGKKMIPLILLGMMAVLFLARLHTYDEPLERDITTYALIGHEALNGRELYSDLWDNKPPLLYALFALGEMITSYGAPQIFFLNVALATMTLLGIYRAVRLLTDKTEIALWAGLIWVIISGDLQLQANQPNSEAFLNPIIVWSFVFFLKLRTSNRLRDLVVAGALLLMASMIKQYAIVHSLFFVLAYLVGDDEKSSELKRRFINVTIIGGVAVVGWILVVGYFVLQHRFGPFFDCLVTFNKSRTSVWEHIGFGLVYPHIFPRSLYFTVLLGALSACAALWSVRIARYNCLLLFCYFFGVIIEVSMPGHFYPHYYQLWLPPLVIGAGWGLERLVTRYPQRQQLLMRCVGYLVMASVALHEFPNYLKTPEEWSRIKYKGDWIQGKSNAEWLRDYFLTRDESFCVFNNDMGYYFYSGKHPVSGIVYIDPLIGSPLKTQLQPKFVHDLEQHPPELFLGQRSVSLPETIDQFVSSRYLLLKKHYGCNMDFLILKDGALMQRLKREGLVNATSFQ